MDYPWPRGREGGEEYNSPTVHSRLFLLLSQWYKLVSPNPRNYEQKRGELFLGPVLHATRINVATLLALFATSLSNRATALLMTVERSGDDNADSLGFIVRAGRGGEKTRSSSFLSLSLCRYSCALHSLLFLVKRATFILLSCNFHFRLENSSPTLSHHRIIPLQLDLNNWNNFVYSSCFSHHL